MEQPVVAKKGAFVQELKAGETYWWCRCGLSKEQPYCDGSHGDTGIEPMEYTAPKDMKVFFCGCKATRKPPFCDGSHTKLP